MPIQNIFVKSSVGLDWPLKHANQAQLYQNRLRMFLFLSRVLVIIMLEKYANGSQDLTQLGSFLTDLVFVAFALS